MLYYKFKTSTVRNINLCARNNCRRNFRGQQHRLVVLRKLPPEGEVCLINKLPKEFKNPMEVTIKKKKS